MLIDFSILSLIVFLPAVGALISYIAGSARAARWIALGVSLIVLGLASLLLAGFLWPDAIVLPKMVTAGAHTYYAVEKAPWVPQIGVQYILGADELSVVLVFLNALLTPLALAISWDEHTRVSSSGRSAWCRCTSSSRSGVALGAGTRRSSSSCTRSSRPFLSSWSSSPFTSIPRRTRST